MSRQVSLRESACPRPCVSLSVFPVRGLSVRLWVCLVGAGRMRRGGRARPYIYYYGDDVSFLLVSLFVRLPGVPVYLPGDAQKRIKTGATSKNRSSLSLLQKHGELLLD